MFHKCVTLPTSTLLAAVAVQNTSSAATPDTNKQELVNDLVHYQCKASDLPLYAPLHSYNKPQKKCHATVKSPTRDAIESGVRVVRREVQTGYHLLAKQKETFEDYVHQAKEHTQSTIDYLNQPHNLMPRTGAIAIGGLSGFIFAARGGFIKKVLYTTIGAGAVASLCYPRQAEQFVKEALFETRKGYAIAYNFVKGVKPGDEVPVEPITKFPTSLEKVKFLVIDLFDEAREALFPEKK
ncbi:MICOS complex subunit 26/27 isoform 1-T5 [Cochliomyia hominivorax]